MKLEEEQTYHVSFDLATPLAEKLGCSKDRASELLADALMKYLGIV